ncbi:nicotinate-nucleotide--dimethylbenzimidazole phosphoribosyltransferase [Candidatus Puniceispirillum marinum]|uniref:Nicotinate-nucleotide--dimethylbenzimidazole phosphoribosyltransferase n=1 Tax=Puniceispirillum marinum (strain IMCC1322) TaxID=488538 RepID=D5BR93_PUNMI|nr:nicotinate-nucleotide--dimethylbenzimidazole phosphoribosyltransferase [Candidatus Puniceispirillum marinum]ADE38790.1 Nicotinate-nucleotide-dimethylbenzimidazole phosphoribosyltransferase [Candidatus Puniceispirillum marinum IMCC1322]
MIFSSTAHVIDIIDNLPAANGEVKNQAYARQNQLTKPPGSLGKLETIAVWMAGWQGVEKPVINNGQCLVFAGNHGVVAQNISSFPAEVTGQMVANFAAGGAAINQLCDEANLKLTVTDIELDRPTHDLSQGPAMTEDDVLEAMNIGAAQIAEDCDFIVVGEMGIGNTTAAAALCMARFGGDAPRWVGPGTGLDDDGVAHKAKIIEQAIDTQGKTDANPVALLAGFGGRELAAIAGAVLAARMRSIPVILDGFISTAAAAALTADGKLDALDHTVISHMSAEPGHLRLAVALRKQPLIDLGMRLGEASGGAVATLIIRAALATHNGMATFAEAGVSEG